MYGCSADVQFIDFYPPILNHEKQVGIVESVVKRTFGERGFSGENLPIYASEDFSLYLQHRPGAFVLLGNVKKDAVPVACHRTNYDFNEDLICRGGLYYIRMTEERLGIKII